MPTGYAFYVSHKGRPKHDYVSTDLQVIAKDLTQMVHDYVSTDLQVIAKDLTQMVRIDWIASVHKISFVGEGALSITIEVTDILEHLPSEMNERIVVTKGTLTILSPRRKK